MMATLYLIDPASGQIFSARAADIDVGGNLTDPALIEALRTSGYQWKIVRDFGFGSLQWRDRTGGFGWGGSQRQTIY